MSSLKNTLSLWATDTSSLLGNLHHIQKLGFDRVICRIAVHDPVPVAVAYQVHNLAQVIGDAGTIGMPVDAWVYAYPEGIDQQVGTIAGVLNGFTSIRNLIVDCESEWEGLEGRGGALAEQLMHGIAKATDHRVDLYLSSFCNPASHPLPYAAFLAHSKGLMPQSYRIPPTSASTVMGRTLTQCSHLAAASLGGEFIPTVNRPEMLVEVSNHASDFVAANVWVWVGSGTDIGVSGNEAEWVSAIAAFKAKFSR